MTGSFRLLLLGQTTSQLGAQISGVAIPLLAVLTLRASPFELGLLTASGTLAFALIGLPAGAWIDRMHRRRPILVASDLARAGLLASVPLAALLGWLSVPQLVVVSFLAGIARVFFDVGYQSYLPGVIGKDNVLAGNSALETVRACGQVAGPGLGGWLVAVIGAVNVVLIQAGTFVVSALSLLAIRTVEPAVLAPAPARAERPRLRADVQAGVRFLVGHPLLRAMALTSMAGNFAFAIASAVSFVFLVRDLGLTAPAIGLVVALGSTTALAGAALTPWLARWIGPDRLCWLALAVTGPVAMLSGLAQPGWLVVLTILGTAAGELGQIIYAITSLSLRQRLCPENMLGRVNATLRFAVMGPLPVGALLGGVLGELVGPRLTLLLAGAIIAISPWPVYRAMRRANASTC